MSFDELLADIDNPAPKRKSDEGGKTRWLGRVKLLATEEQQNQEYSTTVAVWAENRKEFDQVLHNKIASRHLSLLHCENAMPAVKWLYDYPGDYASLELAKGVFSNWPIAFGTFEKIEKPIDESAEPERYLTITEHDMPPLPEQTGIPFWDKEWIVPELKELLFSQPNDEETLNTYLIVDATLRKEITGFFDLDVLDLPVKCLFKGEAAEELKEVAPYFIDMTLPEGAYTDNGKAPRFHKDFFENHWGKNTGIFIRTTAPFGDLWQHLRKFTKVQLKEGQRWVFFRFWDPRTAPTYFSSIQEQSSKVSQWTNFDRHSTIECFIGNIDSSKKAWHVIPDQNKLRDIARAVTPVISATEIRGFKQYESNKWAKKMLLSFKLKYPSHSKAISDDDLYRAIILGIDNAEQYGLNQQSSVTLYIHVMLCLGSYFDTDPLLPWANTTLTSEKFENDQLERASVLRLQLIHYLKNICGNKGQYLQQFMQAFQSQTTNPQIPISNDAIFTFIKQHYSKKHHYLGDKNLSQLIKNAHNFCKKNKLVEQASVFYLSCLRLVYGTRVTNDPLLPWFKIENHKTEEGENILLSKTTHHFFNNVMTQTGVI